MAIAGLVLSLLLGGAETVHEVMSHAELLEEERQISATLVQVGDLIHAEKYSDAYALCDEDFRSYVTPEQFKSQLQLVQTPSSLGKLKSMSGNGIVKFETANGSRIAITKAIMQFSNINGDSQRFDVELRQSGGKWLILRFPFFAEPKPGSSKDDFNL
jgi:hypothetical protein